MTELMFPTALVAAARAPEIPEAADLYGFLVGSWALEVHRYGGVDIAANGIRGELHAARILEGRGIQDVWIMPPRGERSSAIPGRNMYGTTLRIWDPTVQAWRITWINPASNYIEQQIGRARGADIVQLGARPNGVASRWTFTDVTARSFHWLGDVLDADGTTWRREGEFVATRM